MDKNEREIPWIKRVEELVAILEGSSIGELELKEAGTEIVIRRHSDVMLVSAPTQPVSIAQPLILGGAKAPARREDRGQAVTTPLTGVYYASPSPNLPPFVNVGDTIHVGQVVALVEAMKVFNEIQSELTGRVVALVAKSGEVVQKGSALIKVEPV